MDDLWKAYLISRYGTFNDLHINNYGNESTFAFTTDYTYYTAATNDIGTHSYADLVYAATTPGDPAGFGGGIFTSVDYTGRVEFSFPSIAAFPSTLSGAVLKFYTSTDPIATGPALNAQVRVINNASPPQPGTRVANYGAVVAGPVTVAVTNNAVNSVDILSQIQTLLTNISPTIPTRINLVILPTDTSYEEIYVGSTTGARDNATVARRPQLVITY